MKNTKKSNLNLDRYIRSKGSDFSKSMPFGPFKYENASGIEFLSKASESEIVNLSPHIAKLTHEELGYYLAENFEEIISSKYRYQFRKIMAYYDFLKYGFPNSI